MGLEKEGSRRSHTDTSGGTLLVSGVPAGTGHGCKVMCRDRHGTVLTSPIHQHQHFRVFLVLCPCSTYAEPFLLCILMSPCPTLNCTKGSVPNQPDALLGGRGTFQRGSPVQRNWVTGMCPLKRYWNPGPSSPYILDARNKQCGSTIPFPP